MVVMSYIRVVSNPPNPPLRSSVSHNEIATPMIVCIHLIYFIMRSIEHKAHVWLTLDSNPVTFAVAAAVAVDTFKCITRVGLPGSMHTTTVYYNAVRSVPRSSIGVHAFLLRSHTEPALGFERCPAVCSERFATTFHLFRTTNIIGARRHVTEQQRQVRSLRAGVSACKCRNRKSRTCRHTRAPSAATFGAINCSIRRAFGGAVQWMWWCEEAVCSQTNDATGCSSVTI